MEARYGAGYGGLVVCKQHELSPSVSCLERGKCNESILFSRPSPPSDSRRATASPVEIVYNVEFKNCLLSRREEQKTDEPSGGTRSTTKQI